MSEIPIIIISLIFSAFFSGMEIAYVSSNKISIEIEKKKTGFISSIIKILTKKPSKFITTMLIGNNIALVIYGFTMGALLTREFDLNLINQTLVSTFIILITAEFLPKVFFQIYSNTLLKFFAFPAYIFYQLFSFISEFVIRISDFMLKTFFKTEGDAVELALTKVELGNFITEQMESIDEHEQVDSEIQIFQNALEFTEVKAREVMVPRTEIMAIDISDSIENLRQLFVDTGYTKILVYKDSMDDILGYVHSFELFKKPKSIKSILIKVVFVPETILVKDVLNLLTKKRKSIAVVIDEYGGTSGVMTVEDIIEELFGEIEDEHDSVELTEEQLTDDSFSFSARLEVDYLNETYKLNLPESESYETLGGLIVNHTEDIPQLKDTIIIENFKFTIIEVSSTKIDSVHLKLITED